MCTVASGSWGGRCLRMGGYVTGTGPMDRVTAAGGRSCCLSSVSDLVRYRLNRFSVECLMEFLTRLGKDVEIRIAPRRAGRRQPAVHVHHVT
jgi:hypothetical protein